MVDLGIDLGSDFGALFLIDDIPILDIGLGYRKGSLELVSKAPCEILCPGFIAYPALVHPAHQEYGQEQKNDKYDKE